MWVPRHGGEARAFSTGFVWAWEHVTDSGEGARVEVATDEVDGVADRVLTKALQKRDRRVTFLGDFVVKVD